MSVVLFPLKGDPVKARQDAAGRLIVAAALASMRAPQPLSLEDAIAVVRAQGGDVLAIPKAEN